MPFHPDSLPDLTGKVYIVTGGNAGMGYHTVSHLAKHNAHVYMCARSSSKASTALSSLKTTHPTSKITFLQMDLTDLSSVVAAAQRFLSLETSLHGLVNNAGIMAVPYSETNDGHEIQWQTNYLAHWVLTSHLLPVLLKTSQAAGPGGVRIVNVSSSGHLGAPKGGIDFAALEARRGSENGKGGGGEWTRYGQSKLANILHSNTLHRLYGPGSAAARSGEGEVWVSSVHPGLVETGLAGTVEKNTTGLAGMFDVARLFRLFVSAEKGSWTNLYCVAGTDMKKEESGGYREILGRWLEPWWLSGAARDGELAERLEAWTVEVMRREGWVEQ
ncbi:unnamed protein product [Periconia digitata]|uniref:NAD(P)-binding protein n=1 Tax=Periconia digitata TaxID=1303443 RepID=A0A9W4URW0_9PLEO|nr:unnamed protein product [Periconia digitata]